MSNSTKNISSVLFLGTILLLIISGSWTFSLYQKAYDANANVIHTYQTIRGANRLLNSINEAAINIGLFTISHNFDDIKNLPELIISTQLNIATLKDLISDNNTETQLFNQLTPLLDKKIQFLQILSELYSAGNKDKAILLAASSDRLVLTNDIRQLINNIKKLENSELDQANPTYQLLEYNADRTFIALGTVNIILLLLSYAYLRRHLD